MDAARGVACTMLVAYHAVGTPELGLQLGWDSLWRTFADALVYVRMPMFGFIAGYVYGLKPYSGDASKFLFSKARRLLVPMLVVGTVFAIVQSVVPGTNASIKNWATLHILPVAHYWFLEALFIIYCVVLLFEITRLLQRTVAVALIFVGALALQVNVIATDYFALNGVIYVLPYFLFGLATSRFSINSKLIMPVAIVVFAAAFLCVILAITKGRAMPERNSVIGLAFGLSASFLLCRLPFNFCLLSYIGANSFVIFLFHPFFTASTRMGLYAIHLKNVNALVVLLTIAGVGAPILVGKIISLFPIARFAFLGDKWSTTDMRFPRRLICLSRR